MRSARQPEPRRSVLEARAENGGVQRISKAVAHEHRVFILNIHVELAHIGVEEFHDLVITAGLSSRQYDLIGAFLVELSQPLTAFVRRSSVRWLVRLGFCLAVGRHCRLPLDSRRHMFSFCSKMSRGKYWISRTHALTNCNHLQK